MGRQRGQGLVEYALLIALIAVAAAASLRAVGPAAREAFQRAVLTIGDGDITFETPAPTLTAEATLTPGATATPPASVTPGTTPTPQPTATPVYTVTPVPTSGEIKDGCSAVLNLTRPGLFKAVCRLSYSFDQLSTGAISISPALPDGMSLIANLPAGSYTFHGALKNGQPPFSGPLSLSREDLDALAGGSIFLTVSYMPVDGGFNHQTWRGTVNIQVSGIVGVPVPPVPGPIVPKPPVVLD